jgi:putative ABC transport system permease protein
MMRAPGSAIAVMDNLADVAIELSARRSRAVLMVLSVGLAIGALVGAFGLPHIAAGQIDGTLAASTLREVVVRPAHGLDETGESATTDTFPSDAEARVSQLAPVNAVGRSLEFDTTISRFPELDPRHLAVTLRGATSGYLAAAHIVVAGAAPWYLDSDEPIAFLGTDAARQLGLRETFEPTGLTVVLGGTPCQVAGFLHGPDTASLVLVPYRVARAYAGSDGNAQLLADVQPGAGAPVAAVVRQALRPDNPDSLTVSPVQSVDSLRRGVSTQLSRLAGGIGLLLLVLSALLIANSMIVSVVARTPEIGLRRALGTSRLRVASLFLTEGGVTGLIGGLTGGALGVVMIVVACAAASWTVRIPLWTLAAGPLLGLAVAVLASAYPALRAAEISPALAVRAE